MLVTSSYFEFHADWFALFSVVLATALGSLSQSFTLKCSRIRFHGFYVLIFHHFDYLFLHVYILFLSASFTFTLYFVYLSNVYLYILHLTFLLVRATGTYNINRVNYCHEKVNEEMS
jgi:hypothetical protein